MTSPPLHPSDPRVPLALERTFLAWIRTSLALLAGGVALEALDLPVALLRIECYDISHVQGTNVVASMVVVEDGLPKKSDYRRFSITGDAARDDTSAMYDVISRRLPVPVRDRPVLVLAACVLPPRRILPQS